MKVKKFGIKKILLPNSFNNLNKRIQNNIIRFRSYTNIHNQNEINKNFNNKIETKPFISPYYYKDPFFLNETNLKTQLHILKAIENEKLKLNKANTIETENLPTLYRLNTYNYSNRENLKNDEFYYKSVFKTKPLFRRRRPIVDNKLNMRYAENEEQYKKMIEKENRILLTQGKKVKNKILSDQLDKKMDEIKNRIRFMKGIMDFSYPGFVLTKIKTIDKQLKREDELENQIHHFDSPVDLRIFNQTQRDNNRKKYLYESIKIKKENFNQ